MPCAGSPRLRPIHDLRQLDLELHLSLSELVLSPAPPATASGTSVREANNMRRRLQIATESLERLQLSFARFAPQQVVEGIIASGLSTSAEKKLVTVLFADIVGFTSLSERMEPALLVQILNGYFTYMSRAIAEHRGHVSKFIGDGILALFGALEPNPGRRTMPFVPHLPCARPL